MFQDFMRQEDSGAPAAVGERRRSRSDWSALLPFFNERDYLRETVASLAAQTEQPFLILIDNGSTDGSADVAVAACIEHGVPHVLVQEHRPGKVAALAAGLPFVATPYVATCDADTWYPPHYLAAGRALLEQPGHVAAGAYFVSRRGGAVERAAGALATPRRRVVPRPVPRRRRGAGVPCRRAAPRQLSIRRCGIWCWRIMR
ncbi:MAG: glycosyltransferase family 2 protein [Sphingomonas bacterium]